MSKKRARFERAWRKIETAAQTGEAVDGLVMEVVKGGLIIDLGVRGFLPASLVDIRRVADLDEYLGQTIPCKVIELNRARNNVVLSRRAVLEDERKEQRQEIIDRLHPGLVIEGKISNIVDFGAFVDLDGIDGLIHISELSWSHVNHPSEILKIGDPVEVKVLDIDRERQRISLGLKQTQEDPWQRVIDTYHIGDELEGEVTKVVAFGAFVEILDGVEGLVHISELTEDHVENPREVVRPGTSVRVRVLEIDSERRRLSLSIKQIEDQVLPPVEPEDAKIAAQQLDEVPDDHAEDYVAEEAAESAPPAEEGVEESVESEAAVGEAETDASPEAAVAEESTADDAGSAADAEIAPADDAEPAAEATAPEADESSSEDEQDTEQVSAVATDVAESATAEDEQKAEDASDAPTEQAQDDSKEKDSESGSDAEEASADSDSGTDEDSKSDSDSVKAD